MSGRGQRAARAAFPDGPASLDGGSVPHITVEYSANLEAHVEMMGLMAVIHEVALSTGVFPLGGIRVRAAKRDLYIVADGNPENCFIHVTLLIGTGRTPETKKAACDAIFEAICEHLAEPFERVPLAISLTLNELNPELTYRHNNLHKRLG